MLGKTHSHIIPSRHTVLSCPQDLETSCCRAFWSHLPPGLMLPCLQVLAWSTVLYIAVTLCTADARNTTLSWFRKNWCLRFDVFCARIEPPTLLSSDQVLSARRCRIWQWTCVSYDYRTVGVFLSLDHFVGIMSARMFSSMQRGWM